MVVAATLGLSVAQLYPLKRLATAEDIAWAVCWLTHPKTMFTTGTVSSTA